MQVCGDSEDIDKRGDNIYILLQMGRDNKVSMQRQRRVFS